MLGSIQSSDPGQTGSPELSTLCKAETQEVAASPRGRAGGEFSSRASQRPAENTTTSKNSQSSLSHCLVIMLFLASHNNRNSEEVLRLPCGPVVKTPQFHCRGIGSDSRSRN